MRAGSKVINSQPTPKSKADTEKWCHTWCGQDKFWRKPGAGLGSNRDAWDIFHVVYNTWMHVRSQRHVIATDWSLWPFCNYSLLKCMSFRTYRGRISVEWLPKIKSWHSHIHWKWWMSWSRHAAWHSSSKAEQTAVTAVLQSLTFGFQPPCVGLLGSFCLMIHLYPFLRKIMSESF